MEITSGPWARALEEIDKWTAMLTGTLTGSDVLAAGFAAALPILLAIASRNLFGLVATALLVVLVLVIARGGESSLALALYFASLIMTLQGLRKPGDTGRFERCGMSSTAFIGRCQVFSPHSTAGHRRPMNCGCGIRKPSPSGKRADGDGSLRRPTVQPIRKHLPQGIQAGVFLAVALTIGA